MFKTFTVALLSAALWLAWAAPATHAQDLTAAQLYEQGMKQLADGDTAAAKATLSRVDPLQLPKDQRVALHEALSRIDQESAARIDPATLLQQAQSALSSGDLAGARRLYGSALRHPSANEAQRAKAQAGIAEADRRLSAEQTSVRQTIDQAAADIAAGRLAAGEAKLRSLKSQELGWFDADRVDRLLALAQEKRETMSDTGPAVAQPATSSAAPAAASAPAVPAGDDLLTRTRVLMAQRTAAEAREAEMAGQAHLARTRYTQALSLDPNNKEIAASLAALEAKMGQQAGPRDVIEVNRQQIELRRQAVMAEYRQLMQRADAQLKAGNYDAASGAVQEAKVVLDRNQRMLSAQDYQDARQATVDLAAKISDASRLAADAKKKEVEAQRRKDAQVRREEAEIARFREVQALLVRARALQAEQRYDDALQVINQALFTDPNDVAAQFMKEILEDSQRLVRQRELMRERNVRAVDLAIENLEATLPYTELMTYPPDWPQLTALRLGGLQQDSAESEINRRVALKLREPVPVKFDENRLINVFEFLQNTTGVNIVVNWAALEQIGVEQDMPITLKLTGAAVPAEQVLRLVLQQANAVNDLERLGFSIIEGIVNVSTERDLTRSTDIRVYDIRDLLVQVPSFSEAPEFDLNSALSNTSSGGSGGGGVAQSTTNLFGGAETTTETGPTRLELVEQITTLIQDTVGRPEEWAGNGGDISSVRELNGNLIVKSTPENHRNIIKLLAQLRETRAMQIAVEARFLLVEQNFLDEVGVDLDVQINDPGSNFGPIKIAQDSYSLTNVRGSTVPGSINAASAVGPIGNFTAGSGFPGSNRSLDIGLSYLDDIQVNLLIRATQASRRAISVTAPRITFFNGQRAYVVVARQITFISDLEPIPDSVGFDPTLSVTQSGVTLDVEGTISADRRYVTLTVRPSLASLAQNPPRRIEQTTTFTPTSPDPNNPNEPQQATAFIEAPELELTTLRATVSIPDKGTLLTGGQRLTADVEMEAGVPVLSKIPVLNRLVTNTIKVKDERTILILIKPTIIIQSEEEDRLFPGLLDDPQAYTTGLRAQ